MTLSQSLFRKSRQKLMPLNKPATRQGAYDLYPAFPLGERIGAGHQALARAIEHDLRRSGIKTVILDGYGGVLWDYLQASLDAALKAIGIDATWHSVASALHPAAHIEEMAAPFLGGEDPLFGRRFTGSLADFYSLERLRFIQPNPHATINILYGPGAALAHWEGTLIYVDVPKNEIQFRSRAGSITNLGVSAPTDPKLMYKRFYFVDWPAINAHKASLLGRVNWFVDEQRPDEISVARGSAVRMALHSMARSCFRARPWFEPGPWGGQWLKDNIPDLPKDVPNYAWSFELIAPENGLLFEHEGRMLELSFDSLMFQEYRAVLGEFADYFGAEFPIRFDYLDTFYGGDLSIQCHPELKYIREEFGERLMQDECYYITDCQAGAGVHLGFTESVIPVVFFKALQQSAANNTPLPVDRFINREPAFKHELFLIPRGTIHGAGTGNLVLEISSTPYIFTFKLYDWLRAGLDGRPRPLNIARGLRNLHYDRQGERVRQELVAQPRLLQVGTGWRLVHLPTHAEHFYDVHRFEFSGSVEADTEGSCHVINLVSGHYITIETANGHVQTLNFGETAVIPAAARHYRIENQGPGTAMVVKAFLKKGWFERPDW